MDFEFCGKSMSEVKSFENFLKNRKWKFFDFVFFLSLSSPPPPVPFSLPPSYLPFNLYPIRFLFDHTIEWFRYQFPVSRHERPGKFCESELNFQNMADDIRSKDRFTSKIKNKKKIIIRNKRGGGESSLEFISDSAVIRELKKKKKFFFIAVSRLNSLVNPYYPHRG